MSNGWTHGLFSCDMGKCIYAYLCGPCAMASARNKYDGSAWLLNCCFLNGPSLRSIVREGFGIDEGSWVTDCLIGACCGLCNTVQTSREVEHRLGVMGRQAAEPTEEWSTSMTDCMSDLGSFLLAVVVPNLALGLARQEHDGSNVVFNCCCMSGIITANLIRTGYNIKGSAIKDCLFMSLPCTGCLYVAQISREVKKRGPIRGSGGKVAPEI